MEIDLKNIQAKMDFLDWTWPDCSLFSLYFKGINRQVQLSDQFEIDKTSSYSYILYLVDFAKSATANFLVVGCSRRFRNYLVSWQIVFNLIFWSSKNDALLPHS
jgi:hypothetical protein